MVSHEEHRYGAPIEGPTREVLHLVRSNVLTL